MALIDDAHLVRTGGARKVNRPRGDGGYGRRRDSRRGVGGDLGRDGGRGLERSFRRLRNLRGGVGASSGGTGGVPDGVQPEARVAVSTRAETRGPEGVMADIRAMVGFNLRTRLRTMPGLTGSARPSSFHVHCVPTQGVGPP